MGIGRGRAGAGDHRSLLCASGTALPCAPNAAAAYIPLKDFKDRKGLGVNQIMAEAQKATADITEARLMIVPPPVIQGIGAAGGFRMMIQDRGGHGYQELGKQAYGLIGKANQAKGLAGAYTFFDTATRASSPISTGARPTCSASRPSACSRR